MIQKVNKISTNKKSFDALTRITPHKYRKTNKYAKAVFLTHTYTRVSTHVHTK